jgi:hypothetical protein
MARPDDEGYATPAAAVICTAISLVVAALMVRGLSDLRLAQAELARTKVEYALGSAQNAAILAIATSSQPPPYQWTIASLGVGFNVVAEPERQKMRPQAAAKLEDAPLALLGATDPVSLRPRLVGMQLGPRLLWIADQAASKTWRACAPSLISEFGQADALTPPQYGEPVSGRQAGFWRAGEVWRVVVTNPDGWRDERIVRFTGNGLNPAAVLGRRISRGWKGTQTCQNLFNNGLLASAGMTATP